MAKFTVAESAESDIPPLPVGTYPAVISGVFDIGIQESEYMGEKKSPHQLIFRFEVSETIDAPDSDYHGKRYTPIGWINIPKSYDDRSILIKIIGSVLGRACTVDDLQNFDTDTMIGKSITVAIKHNGKGKAVIDGYSAPIKGMPAMTPELGSEIPAWVKAKAVEGGITFDANGTPSETPEPQAPAPEDDLPF